MRTFLLFYLILFGNVIFSQEIKIIPAEANDLNRYEIFLKGEFHDRKTENENSFLQLAKYLHINNKVRYLVFEYGPDYSYLVNRYLQTQNYLIPNKNYLIFSKNFWDSLISFNKTFHDSEKLKIVGFDFNRSITTAFALSEMVENKKPFADSTIRAAITEILEWKNKPWTWEGQEIFVRQMHNLRSLCKSYLTELAVYFDDDWPAFSAILNNDVKSKSQVDRDKSGFKYVKRFLETKADGNVLFNYGISHVFLNGVGMGKLLNKEAQYKGKVCSIYPFYQALYTDSLSLRKDYYLPAEITPELQLINGYSLVNMEMKGFHPNRFKIAQWVFVIPKPVHL